MNERQDNRRFWDRYAKLYDWEVLRYSGPAYAEMYRSMRRVLAPQMRVLELATGTGLIALNIADAVQSVDATDYSPKMIAAAQRKPAPANLRFSVADAMELPFAKGSFDAVIISNALHIMPSPEGALESIRRVLKPGGLLIAPSFTHGHLGEAGWRLTTAFLKIFGLASYAKWTPEEYVAFIGRQGFAVESWRVLKAAFPLVYLEARLHKPGTE